MDEWKAKFPNANHAPDLTCKKCQGKGYFDFQGREMPCICIFVSHDFKSEAAKLIGEFARKELKKLQGD